MGEILHKKKTSTGVLIGYDNKLQVLMACGYLNRLTLHMARLLTAAPGFHKLVVANNFRDAAIYGIGCLKEPARGRVGELNEPLRVSDEHTVRDLVKDGG